MSSLAKILLAVAIALAFCPIFVLRGRRYDRRRTLGVFAAPMLAIVFLVLCAQTYPFHAKFRATLAFFALLNLYAIAPFGGWARWELQLNCPIWSSVRIACLTPLPFLVRHQLQNGQMWTLLLVFGAINCAWNCAAAVTGAGNHRWKEGAFSCAGGIYLLALYLQSFPLLCCAVTMQLLVAVCGKRIEFCQ